MISRSPQEILGKFRFGRKNLESTVRLKNTDYIEADRINQFYTAAIVESTIREKTDKLFIATY